MDIVTIQHVSKTFAGVHAVKDLSLTLRKGEIFGFLGTNGAGKTTTIKMLLGFLRPDADKTGQMRLSVFGGDPTSPGTRRRIGFMPETAYYYPYLNIRELLHFYGGLCGLSPRDIASRAEELIRVVGLEPAGNRLLKTYSKGMLQRAGIAQALLGDPDLLILDEPLTGLDPLARIQFRDLLLDLKKQGKTVFFSSHDLSESELICDRVAIMKSGECVFCDTLASIAGNGEQNLERIFLKTLQEGKSPHSATAPVPACEPKSQEKATPPEEATFSDARMKRCGKLGQSSADGIGRRGHLRQLKVLAGVSLLELYRRKDMIVVFLLSLVILAPLTFFHPFGVQGAGRYINELALSLIWIFSFAIGLGVSARLLPAEFERRSVYPLLAKPVSRATALTGKAIGAIGASVSALFLLYLAFALLMGIKQGIWFPAIWWQAFILHSGGLVLLTALSVLGSLVLTASANLTLCGIVLAGMLFFGARLPGLITTQPMPSNLFLWLVNIVCPHMEFFDLRQRLIHEWSPVPTGVCFAALSYALLYAAACISLAAAVFHRRKL